MPAASPHSTRSTSSAWSRTHPTLPGAVARWYEEADASTVGAGRSGGRSTSPMRIGVVLGLKRSRTPGPYKARGPTTRPPEAPSATAILHH
jgi:hypothetical protein